MQPDFEIAWHGSKWRDDRVAVPLPAIVTTPQGLSPDKRPHARQGGRKPVIAPAVAETLRHAETPLSALQIYARILPTVPANCTVAGVNSALFRLRTDVNIETCEQRTGFGRFSCTYRWRPQSAATERLAAIQLKARKAEIGRIGGLKAAASRRERDQV